jgi:hypothetical protein
MEALLGFSLGFWDYVTFLTLFVLTAAGLGLAVFVLGLPGRIAIARNHPEAEAVYLMGWVGFLAVVPWVQARSQLSGVRQTRINPILAAC